MKVIFAHKAGSRNLYFTNTNNCLKKSRDLYNYIKELTGKKIAMI